MKKLSHTNDQGKARMVDVGHKPDQERIALASGKIKLQPDTIQLIKDNNIKKGDVLTVAEIAGIQAAKQTGNMIPLCHTLQLSKVEVNCELEKDRVSVTSTVKCIGKTGVEMEALTAVSVALLTVYDMCKAVDKEMEIGEIRLVEKTKK
ncbi:MAG: cyclic pyranopterin monophosphate synthase MoaC [Prolixibacteraceae bacterium]|nr:cyclic pyranopterin monophosphate synthase MoaC [Prolixibacteraceae bacterium]MBN2774899.1 cyclic pyranopterin monophosphate synthase MoaC [Prolixibacteraceae bacterium]